MTPMNPIICFEPKIVPGQWGEPFVISTADDMEHKRRCEAVECEETAIWFVEIAGWLGTDDPPYNCPTLFLCSEHLAPAMEPLR